MKTSPFATDQDVRWCPGCGDYAILANMLKVLPTLGIARENLVFISGIGCASRFPYYVNTYGFHTIHGRAPAIATGLKLTRPELSVWVVTGDGDGLSIGANHLIHLLRRNLDIKILLFNNQIYGLTKGQYSPTSAQGIVTKTSPQGSVERPLNATALALTAGATFVARCFDIDGAGLQNIIKAAAKHRGSAFIEILQNCNVFNDKTFVHLSDRQVRADRTLWLTAGEPMLYGKDKNKGLMLQNNKFSELTVAAPQDVKKLLVHQPELPDPHLALHLSQLDWPDYPVAMGILRQVDLPTYEDLIAQRAQQTRDDHPPKDLTSLLKAGTSWIVK